MEYGTVQEAVEGGRKKNDGRAPDRLDLQAEGWEGGGPAPGNVVEVNEDRDGALTSVRGEPAPILVAEIKGVKMLQVLLAREIPPHL